MTNVLAAPRTHLAVILLFSVVVIFSKLGGHGLANYDDCFYAQKAKEILRTGDWMTMHYRGQPAWENAPFFMWLIALSYKLFGISEFAAKFPSALFGVGTIVLVYYFGKYLYNEWTGFLGSSALATTFLFTRYARRAMMDVTLSFFVTLALFALLLAVRKDVRWLFVWAVCSSAGILMKSVLGFFPVLIGVIFLLATNRWRFFVRPAFLASCAMLILLGGAWYLNQSLRYGFQFVEAHFGWLILYRGVTMESQPWYEHLSYIEDLFTYYWPWVPVFVMGLWKKSGLWIKKRGAVRFEPDVLLVVWVLAYLIVMSSMKSRVVWYVMPIFPAAAMIVGSTLDEWLDERRKRYWAGTLAAVTVVCGIVFTMTPVQVESERETDIRAIAPIVRQAGNEGADIVGFREDYYGLNNALLFYSDFAGYPIYDRLDSLAARFASERNVLCILEKSDLTEVLKNIPGARVMKETEEKIVVGNR